MTPTTTPARPALVLFRVVDYDPPLASDFLSDRQRRLQPAAHLPLEHWEGMSVFDTLAGARGLARWRLRKGYVVRTCIAAILVDAEGPLRAEPSPPRGHWTLCGEPEQVRAHATIVERLSV
jgi:hypothetical protein